MIFLPADMRSSCSELWRNREFMEDISGIIFDMDGVLLDTEEVMLQATIRGFADYGAHVKPEDFTPFFGTGSEGYFGGVGAQYGIPYSSALADYMYQKYLEVVDKEAIRYPGVAQEIARLHKEGYKLAVASSAARIKVLVNIGAAGIKPDHINFVVTGDEVVHNKPDPEIFLKAAEGLGLAPVKCLVAEDSISGIRAAVSAGMKCVGVRGTYPDEALLAAGAYKLVSHKPPEIKTRTLNEALSADPDDIYKFRCDGGRLEVVSGLSYESSHQKLISSGIYYDRLIIEKENTVYNMYGRVLS